MNTNAPITTNTIIVGASAAGLAVAACLQRSGIDFVLLEQGTAVASRWRQHYDRLHLHTNRGLSGLPHFPMPNDYPRYPSRDQVVTYLEQYVAHFGILPRFGQQVNSVVQQDGGWVTKTQDSTYHSRHVVIATGYARQPVKPTFAGIDHFQGKVMHSLEYRNGSPFKGQSVLVIGFGNSGGEIAIDLVEHGARSALAVRNAVNVVPRDLFGIPVLAISVYAPKTSSAISDFLFAPLIALSVGDITKLGLRKLPYGPQQQIKRDKHIPLLDIGTLKHIRAGHITVYPGIKHFTGTGVVFEDGRKLATDAVVMATGYRPAVHDFLPAAARVTDPSGVPLVSGHESALPGLYFCGFFVSPNGMLREIGIEAQHIAREIGAKR